MEALNFDRGMGRLRDMRTRNRVGAKAVWLSEKFAEADVTTLPTFLFSAIQTGGRVLRFVIDPTRFTSWRSSQVR